MIKVVAGLMRLGLSEYEAKAYSALVTISEGGIADVSRESGIPRARVYDTMERLSAKGFVEASASRPLRYKAIEPGRVIPGMVTELNSVVENVLASLFESKKRVEKGPTLVWQVSDDKTIDVKIAEVLQMAEKYVTLVAGNRTFLLKSATMIASISQNVTVTVIVERDTDGFKGLLGHAEIRKAKRPLLSVDNRPRVFDYPSRDGGKAFIIELIIVTDNDSLVVYRQDGKRLAMEIEDSIIDSWLRSSVQDIIQSTRPL